MRVHFFDAIDRNDVALPELSPKTDNKFNALGAYACMMSHLILMKMALENKEDAIVVFEDDVIICEDFNARIRYIERSGVDFDMFLLGGHFDSVMRGTLVGAAEGTEYNHIYNVRNMGGTYGYIITKKVMEFCIRNLYYGYGIDQFFSVVVYKRFRAFSFVPFLVGCRPCVSEITGAFWKYDAIDYYYQQEAIIDIEAEYNNPTETEEKKNKIKLDQDRAKWLAENP